MDVSSYLERILYTDPTGIDLSTLIQLQRQHLLTVPFENLDIHLDKPITLEVEKMYQKIVLDQRGGFCYELNGLFGQLLQVLGFKVKYLAARVIQEGHTPSDFDHLTLCVEIQGKKYIVDVGFGAFILHPLLLKVDMVQSDPLGLFIIHTRAEGFLICKLEDFHEEPQFAFTLQERALEEFKDRSLYYQKDANSHFRKKMMISKMTREGRVTLTPDELKISEADKEERVPVRDYIHFETLLVQYFNYRLETTSRLGVAQYFSDK